MLHFKLGWIASCAALLLSTMAATVDDCSSVIESDVERAARLANEIPQGGLGILVIDQQVSFHPGGSLAIDSAKEDAARIAAFISNHTSELSQNITDGVWKPRDSSLNDYVLTYDQSLEASGKFSLTIWPEHCLIGSPGHNIVPDVLESALEWSKQSLKPIQYVMKGSNPFTEHYSALKAEYELPYDPSTSLNISLIKSLQRTGKLVIVGEALSHCVNFTVRDLVTNWPVERLSDLVILTDCSSPVAGFEAEVITLVYHFCMAGATAHVFYKG
ncbi:hypothetical protein L917_05640 [Phytophthora nicotianae]|uniref:Isochorismatase-like domain-containing protein n=2 Tax=Phytophthora nicotianae TaxID=4792 RepID=W2JBJ5_PHYNI|nr:hypothetical protein L915_05817 [Phytophthora nicotianae]ETL43836.1 hypothetical protein L916_05749 [Phytophthora nicotianae]ETL97002.1 hypothetical protein L917_05640 [Phytophthora nicotianae]ETM50151.1 hypothetical protein L914_05764 [Phytophthora nicotianae]ETO79291.1 hypothetical protein F444_05991 [Phytophthora nicotianae P1976]